MDYMIGIHITVIISVLLLIRLAFPRKFGNVPLSLDKINAVAPYQVQLDNTTGLYKFVSDYQVGFSVAFEENDLLQSGESYQFALTNY